MLSKFAVALAIFTTSVILATAAISNDNLQDLKTGHLVGATPWKQQVALLVGCVFGALAIVPVLNCFIKPMVLSEQCQEKVWMLHQL